jgi:hypothetical protein
VGEAAALVVATPFTATAAVTGVVLAATVDPESLPQPPKIKKPARKPAAPNILKNLFMLISSCVCCLSATFKVSTLSSIFIG